jgi:fibro-slime domain-containing protein
MTARDPAAVGLVLLAYLIFLAAAGCDAPKVQGEAAGGRQGAGGQGGAAGSAPPDITRADSGVQLPDVPPAETGAATPQCGKLMAIVRDFRTDHPDFEKDGLNHGIPFPGLVRPELGDDGKPVYAHPGPTVTTTGKSNFDQWYREVPGINLPFEVPLTLVQQQPGRYFFDSAAFFPIDSMGWPGDERLGHNFSFTTEIHTTFRYRGGEVFTFTGDDDVFVFINRKLALDLGGMHGKSSATINLDAQQVALGLTAGASFPLDVFHAERHTSESNFRIETSIECLTVKVD